MHKFWFFIIFLIFLSCSHKKEQKFIIPKDKMIQILIDIHKADAYLTRKVLRDLDLKQPDSLSYYNYIFKKHNITRQQFYKSFYWYMKHFKIMQEIYNVVIDSLDKRLAYLDSLSKATFEGKNLWILSTQWTIPEDSVLPYVFFALPTVEHGIYKLTADFFVYPDDLSRNLRMTIIAIYKDSIQDVRSTPIFWKKNVWREYSVSLPTDTTKQLLKIICMLTNHDITTTYMHLKIRNIKLIRQDYSNKKLPSGWTNIKIQQNEKN